MGNKNFNFQPRFALVLANFKTVTKIINVIDEESEIDIRNFAKYIRDIINERIPEIKSWKNEIENKNKHFIIKYYIDNNWKANAGYICIYIDLPYAKKVLEDSAWVGLYVPEEWSQNKKFREKLKDALPKKFMDDWNDPDFESPIWTFVEYEDYANGESFDINGFVNKVEELVSKLVEKRDIIDRTIKQVKR